MDIGLHKYVHMRSKVEARSDMRGRRTTGELRGGCLVRNAQEMAVKV